MRLPVIVLACVAACVAVPPSRGRGSKVVASEHDRGRSAVAGTDTVTASGGCQGTFGHCNPMSGIRLPMCRALCMSARLFGPRRVRHSRRLSRVTLPPCFCALAAHGGRMASLHTSEKKKELLKRLIKKLGEPCAEQCRGEEGVNGKLCREACEHRKMKKMKRFLSTLKNSAHAKLLKKKEVAAFPTPETQAQQDDAERKKESEAFFAPGFAKNKPSTRFPEGLVDIFGGVRPEVRSDVFENSRELYCDGTDGSAVDPSGRVTGPPIVDPDEAAHLCEMCGGNKVLMWAPKPGDPLPSVSASERRFFQTAPFESEAERSYAALVLSLFQAQRHSPADGALANRTLMSWSADGSEACVGYEVPPSAAATLDLLSLDPQSWRRLTFCGFDSRAALARRDVKVVRIAQGAAGAGRSQLPLAQVSLSRSLALSLARALSRARPPPSPSLPLSLTRSCPWHRVTKAALRAAAPPRQGP